MIHYPTYEQVKVALNPASELISPAEIHGLMCGMICAGLGDIDESSWAETGLISADIKTNPENEQILNQLFMVTRHKLKNMDFEFALLLPDENENLIKRAKEFGSWCQGFLSGFGLAGGKLSEKEHFETKDALHKISESARINYQALSISEEDEQALYEITEYIRLAILMIYADMHVKDSQQAGRETDQHFH